MRSIIAVVLLLLSVSASFAAPDKRCSDPSKGLPVARVVEIDPTGGPLYGELSRYDREESFLKPKEVVLTFDDGPMPWITKSILDTLDRYCTKATFFSVGRMAVAYPNSIKDILARGHTLGTHTWSHPLNMRRLSLARAKDQIERGFAAIAMAAEQPIAPFFRFPGLSDSNPMLSHLQKRGVASFTVDVVSNDSYIRSASRLASYTINKIEQNKGGIVLFHDIKSATAKALPVILAALKKKGYKVVHMRSKTEFKPDPAFVAKLQKTVDKALEKAKAKPKQLPVYGSVIPHSEDLPVTGRAPEPRTRGKKRSPKAEADEPEPIAAAPTEKPEPIAAKPRKRPKKSPQTFNELFPPFYE